MKRARAGSISGRLRSASDLEEKGLIDKSQKGVLKDLIISGDSALQAALDLYDRGDASQLEGERRHAEHVRYYKAPQYGIQIGTLSPTTRIFSVSIFLWILPSDVLLS